MDRKLALWFVVGWLVAIVLPPQTVIAMLRGKRS